MQIKNFFPNINKLFVSLLFLVLAIGGISAQAAGVVNTPSGGYLICVNAKTSVATYPAKTKCPSGFKKLMLGTQGSTGVAGTSGKDGRTLLNGIKDPESTLGEPGDIFINSLTKVLFGPKSLDGTWPTGVSIVGPQGPGGSGSAGPVGAQGIPGTNATLTCAQGGTCILGNTGPGGGIVFYVSTTPNTAATPWRYLEAAPNTWSTGVGIGAALKWCSNTVSYIPSLSSGTSLLALTSTEVGQGFFNTKMMLGGCTFGAANMAAASHVGGKSDWYLPSKDELNLLYLNKVIVGGFEESFYWSSTENNQTSAYYQHFQDGSQNFRAKSESNYVRPIRAF